AVRDVITLSDEHGLRAGLGVWLGDDQRDKVEGFAVECRGNSAWNCAAHTLKLVGRHAGFAHCGKANAARRLRHWRHADDFGRGEGAYVGSNGHDANLILAELRDKLWAVSREL